MEEIWKDIVGYEGSYSVSNLGIVKGLNRVVKYSDGRTYRYGDKLLRLNINKRNGYCCVHLYKNQIRKAEKIHRLVAEAFIENPLNLTDVNHIDGNKLNNRIDNLEWSSRSDNMKHGFKTGLINNTGILHGNNKYSEDQIRQVKQLIGQELASIQIEKLTNVKASTVNAIRKGLQWIHIK